MQVAGIVADTEREVERTDVPIVLRLIDNGSQRPRIRIVGRGGGENLLRGGDMVKKGHDIGARWLAIDRSIVMNTSVESQAAGARTNLHIQRVEDLKFKQRNGDELNLLLHSRSDAVCGGGVARVGNDPIGAVGAFEPGVFPVQVGVLPERQFGHISRIRSARRIVELIICPVIDFRRRRNRRAIVGEVAIDAVDAGVLEISGHARHDLFRRRFRGRDRIVILVVTLRQVAVGRGQGEHAAQQQKQDAGKNQNQRQRKTVAASSDRFGFNLTPRHLDPPTRPVFADFDAAGPILNELSSAPNRR